MRPDQIPEDLLKILDERGGKFHNRQGPVVACLAEILTKYDQIKGDFVIRNFLGNFAVEKEQS